MAEQHTPGAVKAAKRILKLDANCLQEGDQGWTMEAIAAIIDQETATAEGKAIECRFCEKIYIERPVSQGFQSACPNCGKTREQQ